jgi:hypothetical protein
MEVIRSLYIGYPLSVLLPLSTAKSPNIDSLRNMRLREETVNSLIAPGVRSPFGYGKKERVE